MRGKGHIIMELVKYPYHIRFVRDKDLRVNIQESHEM
jgi:hypothetical protein